MATILMCTNVRAPLQSHMKTRIPGYHELSHESAPNVINILLVARKTLFIGESCCWENFACTPTCFRPGRTNFA